MWEYLQNRTLQDWMVVSGIVVGVGLLLVLATIGWSAFRRLRMRQRIRYETMRLEAAKIAAKRGQLEGEGPEKGRLILQQLDAIKQEALEYEKETCRVLADLRKQVDSQSELLALRAKEVTDLKDRFKRGAEAYTALEKECSQAKNLLAIRSDECAAIRDRNEEVEALLRSALSGQETVETITTQYEALKTDHAQINGAARMMEAELKRKITENEMLQATITDLNNTRDLMASKVLYLERLLGTLQPHGEPASVGASTEA